MPLLVLIVAALLGFNLGVFGLLLFMAWWYGYRPARQRSEMINALEELRRR